MSASENPVFPSRVTFPLCCRGAGPGLAGRRHEEEVAVSCLLHFGLSPLPPTQHSPRARVRARTHAQRFHLCAHSHLQAHTWVPASMCPHTTHTATHPFECQPGSCPWLLWVSACISPLTEAIWYKRHPTRLPYFVLFPITCCLSPPPECQTLRAETCHLPCWVPLHPPRVVPRSSGGQLWTVC